MFARQVAFAFCIFVSLVFSRIGAANAGDPVLCRWKDDVLPSVDHAIRINTNNLKLYTDDTAEGYFDVRCRAGYRLNEAFGARVSCLESGEWSRPLPECISRGSCLMSDVFDYIQKADGIRIDQSKSFIITDGIDDNKAIGGSNITIDCRDGYENQGGSSLVQCTEENAWTTFPKCVSTAPDPKASRCPVDDDLWNIPNGYLSKSDEILIYSDNTATGSAVVSCSAGYVLDPNIGNSLSCNGGSWSPKPICVKTGRCSFAEVETFIRNPKLTRGLDIASQKLLRDPKEDGAILVGSYISFRCRDGYSNTDGALRVTCNNDGQWSSFPSCTANK